MTGLPHRLHLHFSTLRLFGGTMEEFRWIAPHAHDSDHLMVLAEYGPEGRIVYRPKLHIDGQEIEPEMLGIDGLRVVFVPRRVVHSVEIEGDKAGRYLCIFPTHDERGRRDDPMDGAGDV